MMRQTCFHCRINAQDFVDASEIAMHEVESDSRFVILQLLAECVGQAREASNLHPLGEFQTFHGLYWMLTRPWVPWAAPPGVIVFDCGARQWSM
jgi:hypothetical protein